MASLQTKLCKLFDITQVFITSIKARNGLVNYPDYCELRLKARLQPIVQRLQTIMGLDTTESEEMDFDQLYQQCYHLWTQFFSDYQQRWTVRIIDNDDDQWRLLYCDFKELLKSAHFISHKIADD
jgi:hypothetical protein